MGRGWSAPAAAFAAAQAGERAVIGEVDTAYDSEAFGGRLTRHLVLFEPAIGGS